MRIMFLYKAGFESDAPPTPEEMEKMGAFIGEIAATGHLLSTDCWPAAEFEGRPGPARKRQIHGD